MEKTIIESKRTSKDHIKVRLKMVSLFIKCFIKRNRSFQKFQCHAQR